MHNLHRGSGSHLKINCTIKVIKSLLYKWEKMLKDVRELLFSWEIYTGRTKKQSWL